MRISYYQLKQEVVKLRKVGRTYGEIQKILDKNIPKSTLSYWCKKVPLSKQYQKRIKGLISHNFQKGRAVALLVNQIKRKEHLELLAKRNIHLVTIIKNKDTAKIALAMLYLGEGSKDPKRGSMMFGNSDPVVVNLFLRLMRYCYDVDESKFRCTLQCRADQKIKTLEKFWSQVTKIPLPQFYKARIDPRTIDKPSKKLDYKGVCRIDYFSADLFWELKQIAEIIDKGV